MVEFDISKADYGDLTNTLEDYSVDSAVTDGVMDQKETSWINTDWGQFLGYYKLIPELKAAIDAKARWLVGSGYDADEITTMILDRITGFGKDTFITILENDARVYQIGGDSYNEQVRDKEGNLLNLKPLDPSSMKHVVNRKGRLIRFELITKVAGKKTVKKFKPEEIFYLPRDRVADEIHGQSIIHSVERLIIMRNEAMEDMKTLMHRHVIPIIKWQLTTDDDTEIAEFKAKADKCTKYGENIFIPMGAVDADVLAVPPNATLNSLPWIDKLNSYFYQEVGVPQIVVGGSMEMTEATARMVYLAYEQTIKEEQLFFEEQVLQQLGFQIKLRFPASLMNDMLTSMGKGETMQASTPEDTTVKEQGVTKI